MIVFRIVPHLTVALGVGLAAGLEFSSAHVASGVSTRSVAWADPSAQDVLDRAVEAVGGRQALDGVKTLRAAMTMTVQGMNIQMETRWSRSGGRMVRTTMPMGEMLMVSDGTIAWMKDVAGKHMLLNKDQADNLRQQAGMFMDILDAQARSKDLKSIENAGKQALAERDCWRLHYTTNDGKEGDMFFDVETALPSGFESVENRRNQEVRTRAEVRDWKPEGNLKFYRAIRFENSEQPGPPVEMTVTTIEVNTLEDASFAAPEEVKALAARSPASAPASTAPSKEITLDDLSPAQRDVAAKAIEGMKKAGDVNAMKLMVQRVESVIDMMPPDQQMPVRYAVQEVKKEIAKLGG